MLETSVKITETRKQIDLSNVLCFRASKTGNLNRMPSFRCCSIAYMILVVVDPFRLLHRQHMPNPHKTSVRPEICRFLFGVSDVTKGTRDAIEFMATCCPTLPRRESVTKSLRKYLIALIRALHLWGSRRKKYLKYVYGPTRCHECRQLVSRLRQHVRGIYRLLGQQPLPECKHIHSKCRREYSTASSSRERASEDSWFDHLRARHGRRGDCWLRSTDHEGGIARGLEIFTGVSQRPRVRICESPACAGTGRCLGVRRWSRGVRQR
jgi:hypothetical protein